MGKVQSAEPENFHITDEHLGEGGAKTKYRRNVDAIRTLQRIEASGRYATPEEQEILSRYVGWGGLADAFDSRKDNWSSEYRELKSLLSEEEYASARASTLNAHYTSPVVIGAIYEAVERMGFNHGNILEPSMGIGNFFGMLPESMRESKLYGVELDSITGRIAKQLYPLADITVAGFETTDRRDFFDLAVGNVPFGNYKVRDKGYDRLNFSIHNYIFCKDSGSGASRRNHCLCDKPLYDGRKRSVCKKVSGAESGAVRRNPASEQCIPGKCGNRCCVRYSLFTEERASGGHRAGLGAS